ncbi:MAG: flippase [Acidobacteriaceae bacterium]|nr:flippase [Acidobacteriaceae bacterium]
MRIISRDFQVKKCAYTSYLRDLISPKIVVDIYWLTVAQTASYICPLLNVVFLTRALGPSAWGTLATFQALSSWFNLVLEYGFGLSGVREVAQNRHRPRTLEKILASVLWAKLALTSTLTVLIACCFGSVPLLRQHPSLTLCAVAVAVGPSLTPTWFYQGLERIRAAALIDVAGRIIGTILTVIIVRNSSQIWIALLIPGVASFAAAVANHARLYRHYAFVLPSPRLVWHALKFGWSMFIYRSSVSLYTIGNAFILALFVAPEYVSYYAAAERIARYSTALLAPLSQALFPRLSFLVATNLAAAAHLAGKSFRCMVALGLILGSLTFLTAPAITHVFLGHKFAAAVPALRILSLLPLVIAVSNFLGFHWLLPLRKDSVVNATILFAGIINLALAVILAPHFRHCGMAWAVVTAEIIVTVILLVYLKRNRLFPTSIREVALTA